MRVMFALLIVYFHNTYLYIGEKHFHIHIILNMHFKYLFDTLII